MQLCTVMLGIVTNNAFWSSNLSFSLSGSGRWGTGNTAALFYLLNPFTIAVCIGGSTSPIENMLTILALYGAIAG
jgi:hypothetical protein